MSGKLPVMLRLGDASHLHLPLSDLGCIKEDAVSRAEMLVAIDGLVALPAEVSAAAATDHVAATRRLLNGHLAGGTLLGGFFCTMTRASDGHQNDDCHQAGLANFALQ